GLPFRVGFHYKSSEVGYVSVDLFGFGRPPLADFGVQRVRRRILVEFHGGIEPRCKVDSDAVRAENICERSYFFEVGRWEDERVGVDVRHNGAIDSDRRVGSRVVAIARVDVIGKLVPVPYRKACITAFYGSVEVVPVVQYPVCDFWYAHDRHTVEVTLRLHEFQQVENAVQQAGVLIAGDHDNLLTVQCCAPDDKTLRASVAELRRKPQRL